MLCAASGIQQEELCTPPTTPSLSVGLHPGNPPHGMRPESDPQSIGAGAKYPSGRILPPPHRKAPTSTCETRTPFNAPSNTIRPADALGGSSSGASATASAAQEDRMALSPSDAAAIFYALRGTVFAVAPGDVSDTAATSTPRSASPAEGPARLTPGDTHTAAQSSRLKSSSNAVTPRPRPRAQTAVEMWTADMRTPSPHGLPTRNRHMMPPDASCAAALKTGASLEQSPQERVAPGRERILVVKFLPARLDAQSELFASELGDHLGILVPAARILRKQVRCHCPHQLHVLACEGKQLQLPDEGICSSLRVISAMVQIDDADHIAEACTLWQHCTGPTCNIAAALCG